MRVLLSIISVVMFIASCASRKEEQPAPTDTGINCNTSSVTYSGTVSVILNTNCTICHSGPSPTGGLDYTNYNVVKSVADDGRLYGAITHASGYTPMPYGGGSLSSCDIAKIKKWIDAGALND